MRKQTLLRTLFPALAVVAALASTACSLEQNDYCPGTLPPEPAPGERPFRPGDRYTDYGENPFVNTSQAPVSTFSVDCDGASYSNMRRWLNHGQNPPAAAVRIEEFLNYFTFDCPEPAAGHNIALTHEVAACPWHEGHLLMRLGIKGKAIPDDRLPPTNYVLLIDVSGSMAAIDKLELLKTGFSMLVDVLRPTDNIAIVVYSGREEVVLHSTSCEEANKTKIKEVIASLRAEGSTAGAAALKTAYEIASRYFVTGGNNRIILGTDGDFNVGISSTEELVALVEQERERGIYLTVLGVGSGNLNDSMMEQLADNGNGNYEYIDNLAQLEKIFIHERSRFHTVARDCKAQVTFDPKAVAAYRLIGYENRLMDDEEFENDNRDAGEIGAGQSVTVLYEIVPTANGKETLASFDVRYKKEAGSTGIPLSENVRTGTAPITEASDDMRFAAAVAGFGMLLKQSEYAGSANKAMVRELAGKGVGSDPHGYRAEFVSLVEQADIR